MQGLRQNRQIGSFKTQPLEKDKLQISSINLLNSANQVIMITKSFSGSMGFEISNPDTNLSGSATINIEMSISGSNWTQAVDSTGTDFTYILASGDTVMDAISGIPAGVYLRAVVEEALTGTLEIATKI